MVAPKKGKKRFDKKVKKKTWFDIVGPKIFNERFLGSTPAFSLDDIKGRTIKLNLMKVTGNMKSQNVNVTFFVNETRDNKAHTKLISYKFIPSSIKRLVRRGKTRVDDSFLCKTKDGKALRIKIIIITRSVTSKAINTSLRHANKKEVIELISGSDYDSFITKIINHSFQNQLKNSLKKIYPLRLYEIREFIVVENKKLIESIKVVETKEKIEEKPVEKESTEQVKETDKKEEVKKAKVEKATKK